MRSSLTSIRRLGRKENLIALESDSSEVMSPQRRRRTIVLTYDVIVVTAGAVTRTFPVAGLKQEAIWPQAR